MEKNKILFIVATHGDEGFAIPVVKELSKVYKFDWVVSNPKALKENARFTQADLNRSGPGKQNSKVYEEKRAYEIIKKASKYDYVIDIHGTTANTGLFIILSNPDWKNVELAKRINLNKVVLWPGLSDKGPLTQFINNSLEIECGPKNSSATQKRLKVVLKEFLENKKPTGEKDFYIVSGKLKGNPKIKLKEFQKATIRGKNFYPLMVNQYKNKNIKCYMMQKLFDTL